MYFLLNQFAKLFLAFFPFFPRKLKTYARVYIFECNTQLHTMVEEIFIRFWKKLKGISKQILCTSMYLTY